MRAKCTQIRKLQQNVKADDIRTRTMDDRELSYIEGWHAISEANCIFGFDGWNQETPDALYDVKIRVTVRTEDHTIRQSDTKVAQVLEVNRVTGMVRNVTAEIKAQVREHRTIYR